ncbi:hypothetical protein [Sphingobium phenoxybenzoativorans]|uniref:hypothetical protein n=1 Tax=Sphingobium phenoxybenzoativorans TaxID=1592790 RepID=UPI0008730626|nr:hypothetical protein [Sphingobium phenoxybenzoativorans]
MSDKTYKAWAVPVWTKPLSDGPALLMLYAAGFADPDDAVQAVKQKAALLNDGDEPGQPYPLSDGTVTALAIVPDSVCLL